MSVSVIIPFRPGPRRRGQRVPERDGASREDIFDWVLRRWEALCPSYEIVVADSDATAFNRSAARNQAFRRSSGDVVIVADADVAPHHGALQWAVPDVEEGFSDWVIGFNRYVQLTGRQTRLVLAMDPPREVGVPDRPRWSTDQGNAGLLIMRRSAFEEVGGYDERFTEWGWEDWAFANALHTLVHPLVTVPYPLIHLHHPRDPDRRQQKRRMEALWKPYERAFGDAEAMRAVIDDPDREGL